MSFEVCQVKMRYGSPCRTQTYKDKKECIFHLENKSDEESKIFEIEFWKEFKRMEKDNEFKELDFTGFIFPNKMNFQRHFFKKPVNFLGAQFNEIADFSGAQFNEDAHFIDAQFNKEADFSGAQFNKEADFPGAQFNEIAYFTGAQFNDDAHFKEAQFNNANFAVAKFEAADFLFVQFNKAADFSGVQFNKIVYFSGAQFNKADFEKSKFSSDVSFIDAKFPSSDEDVIFIRNVKFYKPKDVRFQNINLRNVSFLNTDISEVEFLNVNWARKNGRLAVIDETLIGRNNYSTTYGAVAQLYRRLRWNYENYYRFAEAGEFFMGEMEIRRHDVNTNIKNEKIKNIVLWLKRNISILGIYKHLSLYGESYVRPMVWASVIIISYPMLMHWLFDASLVTGSDNFLYTYLRPSAASFFQMDNTYIGERIVGFLILGDYLRINYPN